MRLGDLASVVRGKAPPSDHPTLRFIGMENVEPGTMRILGSASSSSVRSNCVLFQSGDVLYGRLRPYLNKVFVANGIGLASAEFIPLTPGPNVVPRWLALRLNSDEFVRFANSLDQGDRPRVSWEQISEFQLDLPSLKDQNRSVEFFEIAEGRREAAVRHLQGLSGRLGIARASILKAAVEGRLVSTEAELAREEGREYEHASVLLRRILAERKARHEAEQVGAKRKKKYKEPAAPDLDDLPALPGGWVWATLGQIGEWSSGGTPSRTVAGYFEGGIPWVKSGELKDSDLYGAEELISDEAVANSSAKIFPAGTLLVAMYGATIGMTGRLGVPAATNQACAALLPDSTNAALLPYVRRFLIHSRPAFRRRGAGGAQSNISQGLLRDYEIPLPPLVEQERIVQEIDRRLSLLDKLEETVDLNLRRCERLRQSILKAAFEGRPLPDESVDIQDLTDELELQDVIS
jgi:type I restriction enzyme S subunit